MEAAVTNFTGTGVKFAVFVNGFSKSERSNIDPGELVFWRRVAAAYLAMTEEALETAITSDELMEVYCDA